jgi:hypothetical protein
MVFHWLFQSSESGSVFELLRTKWGLGPGTFRGAAVGRLGLNRPDGVSETALGFGRSARANGGRRIPTDQISPKV